MDRRQKLAGSDPFANNLRAVAASILEGQPESALALHDDGSIQIGVFHFEPSALSIRADVDGETWESIGKTILFMGKGAQWWIGDWLNYGERVYDKTYREVAEATGYSAKTLRDYAYVARNVSASIRIDKLTFAHHQLIAGLHESEQFSWLKTAALHDWSVAELRDAIHPKALPGDVIEREFDRVIQCGIRLGQGDQRRFVEALRRAADQIERSWDN